MNLVAPEIFYTQFKQAMNCIIEFQWRRIFMKHPSMLIDSRAVASLFETLSFFQVLLYVSPKYVFLHKYYAWSQFHRIRTTSQIPIPWIFAYKNYIDFRYRGRIRVLTMPHAKVLSLLPPVMGNLGINWLNCLYIPNPLIC